MPVDLTKYSAADAQAERMIQIYRAAQKRLEILSTQAFNSGALGSKAYYDQQMRLVRSILQEVKLASPAVIHKGIADIYAASSWATLKAGGLDVDAALKYGFNGVNQRAVRILAAQMNAQIVNALTLVGRRTADAFRDAALKEVAAGIAGGAARREVSAQLQQRLIQKGITDAVTGFVDKGGRRWSLEAYTRMVARTTTAEAVTGAAVEQIQLAGSDLVDITSHPHAADMCTPYDGQTFSLTGKTPGYPIADRLPPYHPNCKHRAVASGASFEEFEKQLEAGVKDPSTIPQQAAPPTPGKLAKPKTGTPKAIEAVNSPKTKIPEPELLANDQALWKVAKLTNPPKTSWGSGGTGSYRDFWIKKQTAIDKTKINPMGDGPAILEQRLPKSTRLAEFEAYDWPINPTTGAKMTQEELLTAVKRSGYDGFKVNHPDGGRIHLWRKTKTTSNKSGKPIEYHQFTGGRPKVINPSPEIQELKNAPKVKPKPPAAPEPPKVKTPPAPKPVPEPPAAPKPASPGLFDPDEWIDNFIEEHGKLPTMKMIENAGGTKPKSLLASFKSKYPERVKGLKSAKNPKTPDDADGPVALQKGVPKTPGEGKPFKGITGEALGRKAAASEKSLLKHLWTNGFGSNRTTVGSSFFAYGNGHYRMMNTALRKLRKGVELNANEKRWLPKANRINEFLAKHPAAVHNYEATVYRGIKRRKGGYYRKSVDGMEVGDIYNDPGILSTSHRRGFAESWSKHPDGGDVWKIELPAGWRGLYLKAHRLAEHASEDEIVLPAGMRFRVKAIVQKNGYREITMRAILD